MSTEDPYTLQLLRDRLLAETAAAKAQEEAAQLMASLNRERIDLISDRVETEKIRQKILNLKLRELVKNQW